MAALNFNNVKLAILVLNEKIGIIGTQGMGFRIDVMHKEIGLAIREHSRKPNVLDFFVLCQISNEEVLFRSGIKAVARKVKTFSIPVLLIVGTVFRGGFRNELVACKMHCIIFFTGRRILDDIFFDNLDFSRFTFHVIEH